MKNNKRKHLIVIATVLLTLLCALTAISEEESKSNIFTGNAHRNNSTEKTRYDKKTAKGIQEIQSPAHKAQVTDNIISPKMSIPKQDTEDTGQKNLEKYTLWLVVATALLFVATAALCWITYLLKKVASQEFSATHRPKIIVHTFENSTDDKRRIGPIFTYVNSGPSEAIIKSISSNIFFSDELRPGNEMRVFEFQENKTLKPREKATFPVESDITTTSATIEEMKRQRNQSSLELFCVGRITYVDDWKTKRETGFCRKFDDTRNTWLKVENSDYEYSY